MSEYKDYVVVRHCGLNKIGLCQAPAWSYLEPNDEVILDTGCRVDVISSITLSDDAEILNIIMPLADQDRIPKIKSKVVYSDYTYPDAENEDNSDEQTV